MAFIFGGNTPWTYEDLQRKRAVAESLLAGAGAAPRNVGEGLNAIGKALAYRGIEKRASKEEARLRDEFNAKWGSVMGGIGGASSGSGGGYAPSGTWTPEPPKPDAVEVMQGTMQGGLSFPGLPKANLGGGADLSFGSATMTPQEMLIEGAKARGMDPIDVATAISYETGGTFDPMISGPTTQWGTHRGPIQFGEPQAEKYGIDFSSPEAAWRSSLDPTSGGVWKYLEDAGVQPGMGLPEIYSAINAGAVGRMGASDANNGGAPGTVADKVAGMGPHREKAAAFLGGTWTPNEGADVTMSAKGAQPSMGMDIASLAALAGDPMASPAQRAIVEALIGQQMAAMDPMRQIEMERAQLELAQMKNPTEQPPEDFTERMFTLNAMGIDPQSEEGQHYVLTGKLPDEAGSDVPAGFATLDMQAQAAGLMPGTPEYQEFMRNGGTSGAPAAFIALDMQAKAAGLEPGTPPYQEFMATRGAGLIAEAKAKGEDAALLDSTSSKMAGLETVVSELEALADKATYTTAGQLRDSIGRQFGAEPSEGAIARAEYIAKVDNQVLPMLRDTFGAAFTVKEGETLRATLGDANKSPAEKKAVLRAFIEQKKRDIAALEERVGREGAGSGVESSAAGSVMVFDENGDLVQ